MKLISCKGCGVVIDLSVLRKNHTCKVAGEHTSYIIDDKEYFQCRICFKRNGVNNDEIFDTTKK
jgi:hypothetical protein